ncbi:hypothetical protein [Spirillospora sp. CA-128828]|uniref:hypothetical protein n=1 Tax=Spirillospora sp. CA-128828 TaxID=3240033 RepID=UPI003D8D8EDD
MFGLDFPEFDESTTLRPVVADLRCPLASGEPAGHVGREIASEERDIALVDPYGAGLLWESLTELHKVVQGYSFRRFTRSVDFGL